MSKPKPFLLIGLFLLATISFVLFTWVPSFNHLAAPPRGSYPENASIESSPVPDEIHRQAAIHASESAPLVGVLKSIPEIDLTAYGQLDGYLSDGSLGAAGSSDLEVFAFDAIGMGMSTRAIASFSTGLEGRFGAKLPVGNYVLVAKNLKADLSHSLDTNPSPNRGASIPLEEFQIFEDQVTTLTVVLNHGNVVYGQVINSDDPASTSFMVRVIRESDNRNVAWAMVFADSRASSSDQNVLGKDEGQYRHGPFAFPRFVAGGYRLEVSLITGPGDKVNEPWSLPFLMPDSDLDLGTFEISARRLRGASGPPPPVTPNRIKWLGGGRPISGKRLEGESFDDFLKRMSSAEREDG